VVNTKKIEKGLNLAKSPYLQAAAWHRMDIVEFMIIVARIADLSFMAGHLWR